MTHFDDLTGYSYFQDGANAGTLNVGWLSGDCDFPQGSVTDRFLDRLWLYCLNRVSQTRGFHPCELCSNPPRGPLVYERNSQSLKLGTAEIRVFGTDGRVYAAPDLIMHYICDHQYLPPEEFVEAVLLSELPGSPHYQDMLQQLGLLD